MQSRTELDEKIERLERVLLSDSVDARARKIDRLIADLEKRRDQLYDKAFPTVGGNGVCKDGAALDAVGAIDQEIKDLRLARSRVLSGEVDEEPKAIAPPLSPLTLPQDWPKLPDDAANPLDALEVLPGDKAEFEKLFREVRAFGVKHVSQSMLDFREAPGGELKATPTVYSQAQHVAWSAALGAVWAETRLLLRMADEKRERVEGRLQQIEGKQATYERAMQANRHIAGVLMKRLEGVEAGRMKYAGVWAAGEYQENNIVTHQGSSWICRRATDQPPGDGDTWSLMTKRGRDGKDATKESR